MNVFDSERDLMITCDPAMKVTVDHPLRKSTTRLHASFAEKLFYDPFHGHAQNDYNSSGLRHFFRPTLITISDDSVDLRRGGRAKVAFFEFEHFDVFRYLSQAQSIVAGRLEL